MFIDSVFFIITIAFAVLIKEHLYKPLFTLFLLLDTKPSIKIEQKIKKMKMASEFMNFGKQCIKYQVKQACKCTRNESKQHEELAIAEKKNTFY